MKPKPHNKRQLKFLSYNIELTNEGKPIKFTFNNATAGEIQAVTYIRPEDTRCSTGIVMNQEELATKLKPVLGSTYPDLIQNKITEGLIQLHHVAILGFQRFDVIDPRLHIKIATAWDIFLDKRIFPQHENHSWLEKISELIAEESVNPNTLRQLASDIKDQLLDSAKKA